jgi:ribonucleoside-diphosphate reductase alpha chain
MNNAAALSELSQQIWDTKYRFRDGDVDIDATIEDTWRRTARALASVEPERPTEWESKFYAVLQDMRLFPVVAFSPVQVPASE